MTVCSRAAAIDLIENTFPADAPSVLTAQTGQSLLERARRECSDWRLEPDDVLLRYARLCQKEVEFREAQYRRFTDAGS